MGNELFRKVIELSGLPKEVITKELNDILKEMKIEPSQVTEPELRSALARYLRNTIDRYST
ncbi:MAG: hypothetical protein A3B70_05440 [Deltaproteobacteria bacterium RIFCSPHIGHO2_02_FULL_40_11]|nr:MAG: hypothetical protein A3B70_05440 [Deltaproteobacteria bacterium RIFCSPHIGHO2_02_FULL_40_11]